MLHAGEELKQDGKLTGQRGRTTGVAQVSLPLLSFLVHCSKIAEAEAAVSVNEKKWLLMHMHVQLQLDELRGPQTLGSL
jgi:hypothetical protein